MANWFSKKEEELPPELKGKTPEQIAASLKEADEVKTRLQALEGERATEKQTVVDMTNNFNTMKTRLQELEANAKKAPSPPPEEKANFLEDGDRAFNQRFNENVAPTTAIAVGAAQQVARISAQQHLQNLDAQNNTMDARLFTAWSADIDSEAKKYQPTQLIQPQSWLSIFYFIKGVRADELANPEVRKKKYSFLEPARSSAPPPDGKEKSATDQLTDQEIHAAKMMHKTPEQYLAQKKKMQFINA